MKIFTVLILVLIFIVGCWFSFEFVFRKKNDAAEKNITGLISSLNQYLQKHGNYPDKINSLTSSNDKAGEKLFGLFSIPEIRYELEPDKSGYKLYYYEAPFGPFHGYSSKEKEWYYEE